MKVIHISTGYNHGGAAIACKRLVEAQRLIGIDARVLTQESGNFPDYVQSTTKSKLKNKINFLRLAIEKFVFLLFESSKEFRFVYSLANTGEALHKNALLKSADIIHLHWINGGFVSLKGLKKIMDLGKPIVWTLHDIWPLTGGCHIVADCTNYKNKCVSCFYLKRKWPETSVQQQNYKLELYKENTIHFVAPSGWQKRRALSSRIIGNSTVTQIPNAIQSEKACFSKQDSRKHFKLNPEKKLILFGAFNVNAEHKGMHFLIEALQKFPPDFEIELMIFGRKLEELKNVSFKINYMGYISGEEEMLKIYTAADVFVSPSIEDNLPNTILESFCVGTPVVSFKTGGIPDIIDHKKNGYLAEYKNSEDLAAGIRWCLENNKDGILGQYAKEKINTHFSNQVIGEKFKEFYENLLIPAQEK